MREEMAMKVEWGEEATFLRHDQEVTIGAAEAAVPHACVESIQVDCKPILHRWAAPTWIRDRDISAALNQR